MWTQAKYPGQTALCPDRAVLVTELDPPLSPAFVKIVFLPPDEASRLGQAGAGWQAGSPVGKEGSDSRCG
jgi:hypothetical protein